MKSSESIEKIAAALLSFQSEIGKVAKNAKGHTNRYTNLEHVIDIVRPVLVEKGLCVTQCVEQVENGDALTTTLIHAESGQWIRSSFTLIADSGRQMNDLQKLGSAISYARRYCLLAILNVASGEDDDGVSGGNIKPSQKAFEKLSNPQEPARKEPPAKDVGHSYHLGVLQKRFSAAEANGEDLADVSLKAKGWIGSQFAAGKLTPQEQGNLILIIDGLEKSND